MKLSTLLLGTVVCFAPMACAQTVPQIQKKIIEVGWDEPSTARLRANLKEMEKTPFDGVTVTARGTDDAGKRVRLQRTFSTVPWKKEWFQKCVDDLKAVHSTKLTDNFIKLGANPGNVDWFDDAGWKAVVNHWRIAAWIAKEGHLKGILFDPTTYTKPYKQFQYIRQPHLGDHTFAQCQAKARQRGREVISAVAAVDPDCTIFTFYMNSMQVASRKSTFDLYPAFINGWLDAAPPTITFVDGNSAAYHYNSQEEFLNAANQVRNSALRFVAPQNRQKYKKQVQTAFGLYLDANVNPSTSSFYIDPKGVSRLERLKINATYAANAATQYIWCYGEHYRWWPTPSNNISKQTWEQKMPGITQALLDVTHPEQATERAVVAAQKSGVKNRVQNASFAKGPAKKGGLPMGWSKWQEAYSHGTFRFDRNISHAQDGSGSIKIAGAGAGMATQSIPVKPGQRYVVQAWTRYHGRGVSVIRVRWKTPEHKWTNKADDVLIYNSQNPAQNKWQKIQGIATVPAGVGNLIILMIEANQPTQKDAAWYDDVSVRQIQ